MKRALIIGANSAIARATARLWAARGWKLFLVGRHPQKLASLVDDLRARGNSHVFSEAIDLTDATQHERLIAAAAQALGGIDVALIAHGELGEQKKSEASWAEALRIIDINFLSAASLLTHLANRFESAGSGHIAVISSVAGDRARASNYVYGTAKGALALFLSGLRNRLAKHNVIVTDFRLGFVDTPMTASFKKGALWASPESIGKGIATSIECRRDIVYLPWFWRYIMMIVVSIPERLFKRLSL